MQHFIARGITIKGRQILLAYFPKKDYYFLPGGHIELGESGALALKREIMEELGCEAEVGSHLTTFEHSFQNDTEVQNELTLIYGFTITGETESKVDHLEFRWVSLDDFKTSNFKPTALKDFVMEYANGGSMPPFVT